MTRDLKSSRSPERQRLAEAIERRASAAQALDRAEAAMSALGDQLSEVLEPALQQAEEDLEEARERRPQALVAEALGEAAAAPSVAEIEAQIADLHQKIDEVRKARSLLRDEVQRLAEMQRVAAHNVELAALEVTRADPAVIALKDEFFRTGKRFLQIAKTLRSAGHHMQGVEAFGLVARIVEIVEGGGASRFHDDPAWLACRSALQDGPDAPLPPMPEDEPEQKSDDNEAKAA